MNMGPKGFTKEQKEKIEARRAAKSGARPGVQGTKAERVKQDAAAIRARKEYTKKLGNE